MLVVCGPLRPHVRVESDGWEAQKKIQLANGESGYPSIDVFFMHIFAVCQTNRSVVSFRSQHDSAVKYYKAIQRVHNNNRCYRHHSRRGRPVGRFRPQCAGGQGVPVDVVAKVSGDGGDGSC